MEKDTYKTLASPSPETIFKDKGSKFIGRAFPITSEGDAQERLSELWQEHPKATHICYAWQLGKRYDHYRANDDGEPTHSAGMPIYNQIKSNGLTGTLVTVIRYYGGVNLGVGGLKQAYKSAAQQCLAKAKTRTHSIKLTLKLHFEYGQMGTVMRIIDEENLNISQQNMHLDCWIDLSIRVRKIKRMQQRFDAIDGVKNEIVED